MDPIVCQDLLSGFEHDLSTAPDILELLHGTKPACFATAVCRLFQRGAYISFTIRTDAATTAAAKRMVDIRQQAAPFEWWGRHTDGVLDHHNTTMFFMGKKDNFTPPHADWADAYNVAFAISAAKVCMGCNACI